MDPEAENDDARDDGDGSENDEGPQPPAQSMREKQNEIDDKAKDSKAPIEGQVFGEEEEAEGDDGDKEPPTNSKRGERSSAAAEKRRAKQHSEKSGGHDGAESDEELGDGTPDGKEEDATASADESASDISEPLDADPYYGAEGKSGREEAPDRSIAEEEANDLELPDQLQLDDIPDEGTGTAGEVENEKHSGDADEEEEEENREEASSGAVLVLADSLNT